MKSLLRLLSVIVLITSASAAEKPNIVFILGDDVGLDDIGCYGSDTHRTPEIDKLAESGLRFETCYAAPLCGPSRCLLMTGRYAFRTGGITNQSWRPKGPGAKSSDEHPVAALLKQSGYATGMAGKWRQVGETPKAWGFDEYLTDKTAGGWYWQTGLMSDKGELALPEGAYAPDKVHQYAVDFFRRHKDRPFFFYYSMHHVHAPIQRTPDSSADAKSEAVLYQDNIRYMDKQVGAVVRELEELNLREKTLVIFAGDNGTALNFPSTVKGRMLDGRKGSMLEGGSRVPFIASWPGTTPKGAVCKDLISFADPHATFAELAGAKLPEGFTVDGRSFGPQLRGEKGEPREWAFVQLGARWFVRNPGFKMDEKGNLFDMSDAPYSQKLIEPDTDTEASKVARKSLAEVLAKLNPAAGKTDPKGGNAARMKRKRTAIR